MILSFEITKKMDNWYFSTDMWNAMRRTGVDLVWKTSTSLQPYCAATHKAMHAIRKVARNDQIHPNVLRDFEYLENLAGQRKEVIDAIAKVRRSMKPFTMPWTPEGYPFQPKGHYQAEGIRALATVPYTILEADCGLGKTYMSIHALWAKRWMAQRDGLPMPRALVLCPLSLISGAWGDDVEKLCNEDFQMFNLRKYWKSTSKKKGPIPKDKAIYVTNFESVPGHIDDILAEKFDVLIIDESSRCKTPNIRNSKLVEQIARETDTRWLLTGTPMPNGIRDMWQQAKIMDGGCALGMSHREFMNVTHFAIKGGGLKADGTPNNLPKGQVIYQETRRGMDIVGKRMAPVVLRYSKDELDLPPQTFYDSAVDPTPKQRRLMDQMREDLIAELESGEVITLDNAMVKMGKLLQVSGGFIIDQEYAKQDDGSFRGNLHELQELSSNPKIDRTLDIIEGIEGQVLIWAWHKHEVEAITRAINNSKNLVGKAVYLHGGVKSDKEREDRRLGFKKGKYKYLVANHRLLSHGHTFVNCNYSIYYSNSFDAELYSQSLDRIHRIGQEKHCFYYHLLMRNSIDRYILNALRYKKGVEAYVMNQANVMTALKAA
jgi:SNF2 family DNA or RNA helicase